MSEWQPAIARKAHKKFPHPRIIPCKKGPHKIRVRQTTAHAPAVERYRMVGCDCPEDKFWEIHPEDATRIAKGDYFPTRRVIACEHEILTD